MAKTRMTEAEEALNKLEKDLRQLQIEYDSFFAGGRKRPPTETDWRVNKAIKRMNADMRRMKYGDRFRLNNLSQRYAKYSEVWRRRSTAVESGRSAFGYSKVARELDQKRLSEAEEAHERYLHGDQYRRTNKDGAVQVRVGDPSRDGEAVQELYKAMMDSKRKAGERSDVNYEQFQKFVQKKTEQLKKKMGVDQVEYTVGVKDGRVQLKVKGG